MPVLSDPPPAAIDALEAAIPKHPEIGAWVVDLDKFYQKQDISLNGGR